MLRLEVVGVAPPANGGPWGVVGDLAFQGAGFSYRIEVPGLPEPIKAEVAAEGRPLALGSQVSVVWDNASGGLLPRERH